MDALEQRALDQEQRALEQQQQALEEQQRAEERVRQMEERGGINLRVALVDAAHLGLGLSVFVMLHAKEHSPDWLESLKRAVTEMPEIVGAFRMSGDLDYLLRVRVADVDGYRGHLGTEPEFLPQKQGFDSYYGMPCNHSHSPAFYENDEQVFANTPLDRLTELFTAAKTASIASPKIACLRRPPDFISERPSFNTSPKPRFCATSAQASLRTKALKRGASWPSVAS